MLQLEPIAPARLPTWRHFPVMVLKIEIEMLDRFRLPTFAGSLLRGVLGWALKEVCDPATYSYLFETASEQPGQHDAARPFLLVPPLGARALEPGQRLTIDLRLLGRGCEFLPEFTEALIVAGETGFGRERANFDLTKIVVNDGGRPWVAFDRAMGWDQAYLPLPSGLGSFSQGLGDCLPDQATLTFLTPTRLVYQGKRAAQPDFDLLMRAVYRRVRSLLEIHAGLDGFPSLQEDLDALRMVEGHHDVEWVDWERTSSRQNRRHLMGGFVGTSRFRGNFQREWLELLKAGEILHLGKATTFGMGAYRIEYHSQRPTPEA